MATKERPLIGDVLQARGVTLAVQPVDDGHVITSIYQGFTRQLAIRPDQQVRVVVPTENMISHAAPRTPGALLVITDRDRTTRIAPLEYTPQERPIDFAPKGTNTEYTDVVLTDEQVQQAGLRRGANEAIIHRNASGQMTVIAGLERRIKQVTLAEFFDFSAHPKGPQRDEAIRSLRTMLHQEGSPLIERKGKDDIQVDDIIAQTVSSPNPAVTEFLTQQLHQRVTAIQADRASMSCAERSLSPHVVSDLPRQEVAAFVAAASEVAALREEMFMELGQEHLHGLPLDMYSHNFLSQNREIALTWDRATILSFLQRHSPEEYQRLQNTSLRVMQEAATIVLAYEQARQEVIQLGENRATTTDMERFVARGKNRGRIIHEPESGAPLSLVEWAQLPTQALILPRTNTEGLSPRELAAVIFDEILFSPLVCDRQGEQVHMDPASRAAHIEKVAYAIEHGLPIEASQYTPFAAIGNPLKRETQNPTLAEVDMIRRLADVSASVELVYAPGLHWHVTNEVPAFQDADMLDLDAAYVNRFHNEIARIVQAVDPQGKLITLHRLDTFLQGDRSKQQDWQRYWTDANAEMDEILNNPSHPRHAQTVQELTTFAYPMATCTDPYKFHVANHLSPQEIMQVYEAIRSHTHSEIRGVSLDESLSGDTARLNRYQQELFDALLTRGMQMARTYRITMGSREILPAFKEVIPNHTVAYTMVTKRNKPVLYPNSGRGAYFPAHGEAVLVPSSQRHQRSTVTVRPAHKVTSTPSYTPIRDPQDRSRILYWVQIAR